MKNKQNIFFLILIILLVSLLYLLLGAIEQQFNYLLISLISAALIIDLVLMTRMFFRFMKPLNDKTEH